MDECLLRCYTVSTKVQAASRRSTKSDCVVTSSRFANSLRYSHRKNSTVLYLVIVTATNWIIMSNPEAGVCQT
ncbi:hypothetical protein TNCV_252241 [Trichonephila clavipes]|nr:hypothetical protein TNCV_252241 [Trichonephila clavipes]